MLRTGLRVLGVGTPEEVSSHPAATGANRIVLPDEVLIPGLVNAHVHLDLSHMECPPLGPGQGFVDFVDRIRAGRLVDEADVRRTVLAGVAHCLESGVVAVGDIAGAARGCAGLAAAEAVHDSGLMGVSFLEFFAIGRGEAAGQARLHQMVTEAAERRLVATQNERGGRRWSLGLQPHASNTVSFRAYQGAVTLAKQRGLALSTHLAESPEEREFILRGTGPQRELLERLGLWTHDVLQDVGRGQTPVERVAEVLAGAGCLAAHVNDASDEDLALLARAGVTVAYCPRASAYFGAERAFGPHRYRDMVHMGIEVAVGTDSRAVASSQSVLDELRLLHQRDGTPPRELLRMATRTGARALGLDDAAFEFTPGAALAGLVAVPVGSQTGQCDPLSSCFGTSHPPRLLAWSS